MSAFSLEPVSSCLNRQRELAIRKATRLELAKGFHKVHELAEHMHQFSTVAGFPQTLGALNGIHLKCVHEKNTKPITITIKAGIV